MRFRQAAVILTLAGFLPVLASGCGESTEIQVAPATPTKADEAKPLPKEPKQGGGKTSSGNMNRNPGGNT